MASLQKERVPDDIPGGDEDATGSSDGGGGVQMDAWTVGALEHEPVDAVNFLTALFAVEPNGMTLSGSLPPRQRCRLSGISSDLEPCRSDWRSVQSIGNVHSSWPSECFR